MALKWLTAEEMVAISSGLIGAGEPGRTAMEKIPLLALPFPDSEKAHNGIVSLRTKEPPKIRAILQKEGDLDARHDDLVRGIHGAMTAMAPLTADREKLLAVRDKLLPDGLSHTELSYRGEAGHCAVIASQLDDAMKARLRAITIHKKTLLDLATVWLDTGSQLGQLEDERARLTEGAPSLGADMQKARLEWMRVMKALMANAKLAEIDSATDQLLFSTLRTAERASESRAHNKVPAPAPAPAPTPAKT